MLDDHFVGNRKVLLELSVIFLGGSDHNNDHMAEVLALIDKAGLYYEHSQDTTCLEGEWSEISPLIFACYEQVQGQVPPGYLRVSLR